MNSALLIMNTDTALPLASFVPFRHELRDRLYLNP